ncbi:MAG: nicotinamide-nucleotide amidohydrolase family protein [Caulobacter sp.]|nr:nicotinamide-nucleotide amidohydrolase family protein [Caulobacter sp.]
MAATEALAPALPPALDKLTRSVLQAACDRDLAIATAESCTGGLLASLLTDVPGCSHAFDRGFVVYTEEAKRELLGVPARLLEAHGAVSAAAARAMAECALARSKAQIAVSVTGYAESPPGCEGQAGLVYLACARLGAPTALRRERFGDVGRAEVRLACLWSALEMLQEAVD